MKTEKMNIKILRNDLESEKGLKNLLKGWLDLSIKLKIFYSKEFLKNLLEGVEKVKISYAEPDKIQKGLNDEDIIAKYERRIETIWNLL